MTTDPSPRLSARDLEVQLGGARILEDIALDVAPGRFVGLLGPNGSGKTTLLRACHRALRPTRGSVMIGPDDVWSLNARETARRVAVVSQESSDECDFTAAEVAALGRIPHKRGFEPDSDHDRRLVYAALDRLGLTQLAHRAFGRMSGGERQRTLIARALVQESTVLILDEPTNHLDVRFQLEVLKHVRSLGLTTIAALHDLNLAASWCDHIYVLDGGRIVSSGSPEEALAPELVTRVFGVDVTPVTHPVTGRVHLIFDRVADADG
jgi:iron complex transport system ATP-binding protein